MSVLKSVNSLKTKTRIEVDTDSIPFGSTDADVQTWLRRSAPDFGGGVRRQQLNNQSDTNACYCGRTLDRSV